MRFRFTITSALALALIAGSAVQAQDNDPRLREIGNRQALMKLIGMSFGPLRAMNRGDMPYDAETASLAAGNLAALMAFDQSGLWSEGADRSLTEDSATLPEIWEDPEAIARMNADMREAALAMEDAAGGGLDSLNAAFEALGDSCSACHRDYRHREED